MISKVEITNFQSHRHTVIDFCPGLNVIVGASDSGKSAIIRAMLWVIKNRPSGDAVKNWGCGKNDAVEVKMSLTDNGKEETISKRRIGSTAMYSSSKFGNLDVVGRDVPEKVSELLNLADFNIQSQHDAYFLLNDSPGSVAKTVNDLVGLSIIDDIFKNINSRSTAARRQSEESQATVARLDNEIDGLQYLDGAEKNLIEVENLAVSLEQGQRRLDQLTLLISTIRDLQEKLERERQILPAEQILLKIKDQKQKLTVLSARNVQIQGLITSIEESNEKLQTEREWLAVEGHYDELDRLNQSYQEKSNRRNVILAIIQSYNDYSNYMESAKRKLEEKRDEKRVLLRRHNICSKCGQKLNAESIERMVA